MTRHLPVADASVTPPADLTSGTLPNLPADRFAAARTPEPLSLRVWLSGLLVLIVLLGSYELYWRSRGHGPMVTDSPSLWATQRDRIGHGDPRELALLGTSRIRFGFDIDTFRNRHPDWTVARLGVEGRHPLATLHDLAGDDDFRGVVLCEATAFSFARPQWNDQADWLEHRERRPLTDALDAHIHAALGSRLVFLKPGLRLDRTLQRRLSGTRDPIPYLTVTPDRSVLADYSIRDDLDAVRADRLLGTRQFYERSPLRRPSDWAAELGPVKAWVTRIQNRGGRVILIRFPTAGELWTLDERYSPRAHFWDRLADATGATTLHFDDVPGLADFDLPDLSHLDWQDRAEATTLLLDELERLGVWEDSRAEDRKPRADTLLRD